MWEGLLAWMPLGCASEVTGWRKAMADRRHVGLVEVGRRWLLSVCALL